MTSLKSFLILFILTMGLFSFFGCGDKSKKTDNLPITELDTISFYDLSKRAYDYLNKQQDTCNSVYKIGTYQNWYYDQLTGELTFSDNGIKKLIIDYEEVGSVSEVTNTFLWAWGNPHLEEKIKSEIVRVKEYGQKRKFEKLINPKWTADQYDGWEMTAIASYLLKSKGAYRVPTSNDKLFSFMIFKNIRWADTTHLN
ncbi:hypothetical protein DC498_13190 [Terrimonas sp.]|nr:hypothetical protein DC498_13190 [Terrimonas sp.]